MDSINGTYLGEVYKAFPKQYNMTLALCYTFLPHDPIIRNSSSRFQKPTKLPSNEIYTGEISSSKERSGQGFLLIDPETAYEGTFSNNLIQGEGRLYKSGLIFEGDFEGLSIPKGKIYNTKDKTIYEGSIQNLKPEGKGKMSIKGKWDFQGSFKDGQKEGFGVMVWANKDKYEGNFSRDKKNGFGELVSENGNEYKGEWLMDKMHGKGKLTIKGEYVYDGMFSHGFKQGQGKCKWADGREYEGYWMKDKYDGFGKETNGDVVNEGIWRRGVFKLNQSESKSNFTEPDSPRSHAANERESPDFDKLNLVKLKSFTEKLKSTPRDNEDGEVGFDRLRNAKLGTFSEKFKEFEKVEKQEVVGSDDEEPADKLEEFKEFSEGVEEYKEKVEDSKQFDMELSNIVDNEDKLQHQQFDDDDDFDEMGPGIKEFVLSKNSESEFDKKDLELSIKSEKKSVKDLNEPSNSIHSKSKASLPKLEANFISKEASVLSLSQDIIELKPGFSEKPTKKLVKLIIKKPQIVPLLEIRSKIHQDPLYQISYQKFKSLNTFEYDPCDIPDSKLSPDWLEFPKEKFYKGFINSSGFPSGNGVLLQRGRIYQGSFLNSKKHGFGRLITPLGRIYEGYWKKGKKHGFGVFTSEHEEYCGDWVLGLYHGLGVLTKSDGTYDGQFIYGICEGKGILYFPDGKLFQGNFKNGVPHGFGNLKFGSTMEYDQWKEGVQKKHEIVATKNVMPIPEHQKLSVQEDKDPESDQDDESEVDIPQEID